MPDINKEVIDWLKSQKGWQTELGYRLISKGDLSDNDYREVIAMLKGDISYDGKEFPIIGHSGHCKSKIQLLSIGKIQNIEGLAPRKPLEFGTDNNLVVVYGDNGSGKSGYTRIIKKVCGKPGARDLLHNIYNDTGVTGRCTLKYLLNDVEQQCNWTVVDSPIDDLRQMDIFDSETAKALIEYAQKTTYTPVIVSLFESLSNCYDEVKRRLIVMRDGYRSSIPHMSVSYQSTSAYGLYNNLRASHTEADLVVLFPWTEKDEEQLKSVNERLATTDPAKAAESKRSNKRELDAIIAHVKDAAKSITDEFHAELMQLKADALSKKEIADNAAKVLSGNEVDGVGTDLWKSLWNAAKEYSLHEAYKDTKFPNVSEVARCVLCHQPLSSDAKVRFKLFNDYVEGQVEREAVTAEQRYSDKVTSLPKPFIQADIETKCTAAGLDGGWVTNLVNLRETMCRYIKFKIEDADGIFNISNEVNLQILALEEISKRYGEEIIRLEGDAKSLDRIQASKLKTDFEAKKWCSEQKEAILTEIKRLKTIAKYEQWISGTSTYSLTAKANKLSEIIVTEEYVKRFNEELGKLGANNIKIELLREAGKGTIKHLMAITGVNGVKPHLILSEGELRIVALAAFLADVTGGNNCNPFIFDDPISSLDQRFEERTVSRLIELSADRQVIVFTHRMSLLGQLSKNAKSLGVRKEHWGSGEVGETPIPADKPKAALNKLKDTHLLNAKKILESQGSEAYEIAANHICMQIRNLIERIVESTFLAEVIQRHSREVHTKHIHKLSAIGQDDCALIDKFMTKYSKYDHSQSSELPVNLPLPEEIETDLTELITWHNNYLLKREAVLTS